MRRKTVLFIFLWAVASCDALLDAENGIEARGKKKKKIALFVYFADLVIKKIFILKLIYAFVFWLVLHKAGYFLGWFASYLKEKKQEFHEPPPYHHDYGYSTHQGSHYGPYKRQGEKLFTYNK